MDIKEIRKILMHDLFYAKDDVSLLQIHTRYHCSASMLIEATMSLRDRGVVTYNESNYIIRLTDKGRFVVERTLRRETLKKTHQQTYFETKSITRINLFQPYLPSRNSLKQLLEYEDIANRTRSDSLQQS